MKQLRKSRQFLKGRNSTDTLMDISCYAFIIIDRYFEGESWTAGLGVPSAALQSAVSIFICISRHQIQNKVQ